LRIILKKRIPLPVVLPGSQTRRFTHVKDTVDACLLAWKKKRNAHYSVASFENYSIVKLAKLFDYKIKYLTARPGERFSSAIPKKNIGIKIIKIAPKIKLKDYIKNFVSLNS
jgi:UDP-glucose 4-epimerase